MVHVPRLFTTYSRKVPQWNAEAIKVGGRSTRIVAGQRTLLHDAAT
jgi:hypothetical protein